MWRPFPAPSRSWRAPPTRRSWLRNWRKASIDHFDAVLAEVWVPGLPHKAPHDGPDNGWIRQAALARRGKPPEPDPILGQHYATLAGPQASPLKQAGKQFLAWARRNGAKYMLAQPLQVSNRPAGLLAIYCRKQPPPEAPGWAQIYAAMTGATLDSARALSESRKAITQLQFLVEASQVLNSTLNLGDLLDLILNLACKETNADRGSVFLVDQDRREVWTIVAHGLEEQEIRLAFGQGVAGYVAQTGQTLNIDDAYSSPNFDPSFDERFHYRTQNLLCAPIRNRTGEIVGILQLLNKREGRFAREDEEFLNTLSVHMALALENARLHRELLEKQWLERELALARRIQRGLLPDAPPVVPGFDIAVLNEPSYEVGGDYYDFLTLGPNTLLVVIADVEGKGVSSALTMSNLQATLRALVMHLHSLEVITLSLNEMILADTHAEKFLSIFLGLVDTRRTGLHYINAGHIPPIVVRANVEVLKLEEGGTVIGLFDAAEYKRASLKLLPGDVLLVLHGRHHQGPERREGRIWSRTAGGSGAGAPPPFRPADSGQGGPPGFFLRRRRHPPGRQGLDGAETAESLLVQRRSYPPKYHQPARCLQGAGEKPDSTSPGWRRT